jgi:hypothetical protein
MVIYCNYFEIEYILRSNFFNCSCSIVLVSSLVIFISISKIYKFGHIYAMEVKWNYNTKVIHDTFVK